MLAGSEMGENCPDALRGFADPREKVGQVASAARRSVSQGVELADAREGPGEVRDFDGRWLRRVMDQMGEACLELLPVPTIDAVHVGNGEIVGRANVKHAIISVRISDHIVSVGDCDAADHTTYASAPAKVTDPQDSINICRAHLSPTVPKTQPAYREWSIAPNFEHVVSW